MAKQLALQKQIAGPKPYQQPHGARLSFPDPTTDSTLMELGTVRFPFRPNPGVTVADLVDRVVPHGFSEAATPHTDDGRRLALDKLVEREHTYAAGGYQQKPKILKLRPLEEEHVQPILAERPRVVVVFVRRGCPFWRRPFSPFLLLLVSPPLLSLSLSIPGRSTSHAPLLTSPLPLPPPLSFRLSPFASLPLLPRAHGPGPTAASRPPRAGCCSRPDPTPRASPQSGRSGPQRPLRSRAA